MPIYPLLHMLLRRFAHSFSLAYPGFRKMAPIAMNSMTPSELAEALLQQRQVLQDHYTMLRELRARIAANESCYGISAAEVHRAIDEGRIEETHEVCRWLMDIDLLERIEHASR